MIFPGGEKESIKTDSGFLLIDTHKHFSEVIKAIKEKSGNRNSEVFYSIEDKKFILVPSVEIERLKLDVKILKRDSK